MIRGAMYPIFGWTRKKINVQQGQVLDAAAVVINDEANCCPNAPYRINRRDCKRYQQNRWVAWTVSKTMCFTFTYRKYLSHQRARQCTIPHKKTTINALTIQTLVGAFFAELSSENLELYASRR